jgi:glycosyltransferase involved in cell wall biosynthesis
MKKTVWYISKYFAPKTSTAPGGRGWFLMKGLLDLGFNPIVITSDSNALIDPINLKDKTEIQDLEGVSLVWLKTLKYQIAKSPKRIFSWFHFEWRLFFLDKRLINKPDVIVVSSLSLLSVLNGIILKNKYKCRLIFEVRDIWPLTITEEGGFSISNPFVKFLSWIEILGYKKSNAIIGTMPNLKAHVDEVCRTENPVYCIPMGISEQQISEVQPLDSQYVNKYLSSNKMKVVHAGTVGITNALEVFFEAAEALVDNPDIEFILVGDGPLKADYQSRFGHLDNIVFAPKVTKYQVQTLLSYCDVVYFSVFSSKVWKYGQSLNKVVDYLLSGKPVVASYDGYPSMINEADCGFFVPAGDPIALKSKLVELSKMDENERDALGRNGKKWLIENRNYKKLSQEFSKILFPDINYD